jgi:hypothetical protein
MVNWLPDAKPDPKPVRRRRATAAEWKRLRRRKLGPCRVCKKWGPSISLHHLVGRDLGGDDVGANLVPLCGSGTTLDHGKVEHFDREACQTLRASLTTEEVAYVVGRKSAYWLDRRYPLPDEAEAVQANKEEDPSVGSSSQRSSESWSG